MPELLTLGPAHSIIQNVVYACPVKVFRIHSLAAIELSVDGTTFDALTGAETVGAEGASCFIRCPSGNTIVTLKPY